MTGDDIQAFDPAPKTGGEEKEGDGNLLREAESDEVTQNEALGSVTAPEGDDAGENRVTTSLSED